MNKNFRSEKKKIEPIFNQLLIILVLLIFELLPRNIHLKRAQFKENHSGSQHKKLIIVKSMQNASASCARNVEAITCFETISECQKKKESTSPMKWLQSVVPNMKEKNDIAMNAHIWNKYILHSFIARVCLSFSTKGNHIKPVN